MWTVVIDGIEALEPSVVVIPVYRGDFGIRPARLSG